MYKTFKILTLEKYRPLKKKQNIKIFMNSELKFINKVEKSYSRNSWAYYQYSNSN